MPIALNKSPWLVVSVLALAVAACDDRHDARIAAPEPAPLAALDAEAALPYAQPARVDYLPPDRGYQYAERAYGLQRTFYDVEPDYGFDYGGGEPLVWETADDWSLYAEPYDDGYRYYYYEPGADYPYFVRDDDYGYAYGTGGILLAVFDSGGRYLSRDYVYRAAPLAGRYWARGRDLYVVGQRAPRIEVTDQYWTRAAPRITRSAEPWIRAASAEPRWREWRVKDRDRELNRFRPEQERRGGGRREARFDQREDQRFTPLEPSQARFDRRGDQPRAVRFQEARGRAQAEQQARAQEQARAHDEARGRQQAQARGREQMRADQQARSEQARGREQAERSRQQAQAEQRGRQQAEAQARQQQQQQARAEQQARGREQAQARQQAEAHARQAQQQQARAEADRRGQMQAQRAQQAQQQQQARAAEQHARQAAAQERAQPQRQPQARPQQQRPQQGGGGRAHPQGNGKDRKD